MGFLSSLGGIINDQFGIGENTSHSLDTLNGEIFGGENFGKLGEFAKKIDQSAERYYMEDGFIRDIRPRSRSILFQQPDIYVVIKKRMFSTLQDNCRLDLLEKKERILIAATKRLFQNKMRLLAAYERLTKIEQLTFDSGRFNTFLGPSLFNLLDADSELFNFFKLDGSTKSALDKLRKVISYGEPGQYSNWTTNDWDAVFGKDIGEGPGTLELTNIASIKTNVSTEWGGGSATLTIEDPYNLLTITERDIDQALTDVTNPMRTGTFFKFTDIELQNRINDAKSELAIERYNRQASQITFKLSPGTLLSKRVRAIIDDEGTEIKFSYSTGVQQAFDGFENASNFWDVATSVTSFFSTGAVQIEPQFLAGNESGENLSARNQLSTSERRLFIEIISDIFTLLAQRQTSRRELKRRSAEINYARNRMRLFFNGKYAIQPMDTVTIWMNSRTDEDGRLPGGFTKQPTQTGLGLGLAQKFDTIVKNINNLISDVRGDFSSNDKFRSWDDIERISIVGEDMPKWLWRQFRQDIVSQPTGPCIFSGLVGKGGQGVSGSWNDGKWTITVTCEDNTGYFDKSQINFKPAADVWNSSLYDPLTPFDVSFDAATGVAVTELSAGDFPPLLPENQKLLQSGVLTFRSGENKGASADDQDWRVPSKEISFDQFRAVLHEPEGMVYRWKNGIQTLTFASRPSPQTTTDQERTVLLTAQPFAGQDVMNVISLLITGQPYNYGTFLKAAIANGNSLGRKDELNNIAAAQTYIQGILSEIERVNLTWGNFIPHKKLTVSPEMESFISHQRLDIVTQNEKLKQKLNERAKLEDELILQTGGFLPAGMIGRDEQGQPTIRPDGSTVEPDVSGTALDTKINALSDEIRALQNEYDATINSSVANNPDIGLTLIGNDVNSNPTLTNIDDAKSTPAQRQRDELQLRQKLFKFTARRYWQVRANDDQNLFIVDDQYDKNYDIQAFERKIGGKIETFHSDYSTIGDQLVNVRKLLGLECFANTQGHIEVRPPLYNRIPSSVFYKMFQERDEMGVKVFPDFLENLYFNQIKGIFHQIEIIEDEIRLRAVALGARNDNEIRNLLSSGTSGGSSFVGFEFLTTFTGDGRIGTKPLWNMLAQSNPDFMEGWNDSALKQLDEVATQISKITKISALFTPNIQARAVATFNPNVQPNRQEAIIDDIRQRLRMKTGREPKKIQELFGNPRFQRLAKGTTISRLDRLNVFNQISGFLNEHQTLLRSALNAIRHLKEGVSINAPDGQNENIFKGGLKNLFEPSNSNKTARALTTPFLNRKTEIPQFLSHMIEYEDEDDIGPNSGRRFILSPDRIVSMTISENPPPYTMVAVKGLYGEGLLEPASTLRTTADGNALTTAYAVDYDMWYQYGLRVSRSIEAPFLSDPDSECAPFAVATLLEARENILQGSVQVAGYNEFYQPGDVVYIEDRNLLFYVKSVSHSFSYGKLDTTLELNYGHSPGEYIPTMLDVVGKILYNARGFTGQFRSERQEMLGSARSIGALVFSAYFASVEGVSGAFSRFTEDADPLELLLRGRWGERNKDILSNILYAVSGSLNQVSLRRQKARIKIVYYVTGNSEADEMLMLAESVRDWLLYPEGNSEIGLTPLKLDSGGDSKIKTFGINNEDVIIEEVDMTDPKKQTRRVVIPQQFATEAVKNDQGPSNAAVQATRALDEGDSNPRQFKLLLANSILDIFVEYELVKKPTTSATDGLSEAGQAANAAIDAARGGRATGV